MSRIWKMIVTLVLQRSSYYEGYPNGLGLGIRAGGGGGSCCVCLAMSRASARRLVAQVQGLECDPLAENLLVVQGVWGLDFFQRLGFRILGLGTVSLRRTTKSPSRRHHAFEIGSFLIATIMQLR